MSVLALCGGVGGAKLAQGLYRALPPNSLTVVVNTGDDFDHLGLRICPDLDTVLYTLGGLADPVRGWGRQDETWNFMEAIRGLGGESWFQLGDRDLALHVERTGSLRDGSTLTAFIAHAARQFGIAAQILPMTDDDVRTMVTTEEGTLVFQRYFVERRCAPAVRALEFVGAAFARRVAALDRPAADPALRAIVICPSNPYLSIDPILAVPGIRQLLEQAAVPVIAVSPLIGGQAVKGPTAKIMAELGIPATTAAIAAHYRPLIDGLMIDETDAADAAGLGVPVAVARTLMRDEDDRLRLAHETLAFADRLRAGGDGRGRRTTTLTGRTA